MPEHIYTQETVAKLKAFARLIQQLSLAESVVNTGRVGAGIAPVHAPHQSADLSGTVGANVITCKAMGVSNGGTIRPHRSDDESSSYLAVAGTTSPESGRRCSSAAKERR